MIHQSTRQLIVRTTLICLTALVVGASFESAGAQLTKTGARDVGSRVPYGKVIAPDALRDTIGGAIDSAAAAFHQQSGLDVIIGVDLKNYVTARVAGTLVWDRTQAQRISEPQLRQELSADVSSAMLAFLFWLHDEASEQDTLLANAKNFEAFIASQARLSYHTLLGDDQIEAMVRTELLAAIAESPYTFRVDPTLYRDVAIAAGRALLRGAERKRSEIRARDVLRSKLRKFFSGLLIFLARSVPQGPIAITSEGIEAYQLTGQTCGSVPCNEAVPSCCADCDPCPNGCHGVDLFTAFGQSGPR